MIDEMVRHVFYGGCNDAPHYYCPPSNPISCSSTSYKVSSISGNTCSPCRRITSISGNVCSSSSSLMSDACGDAVRFSLNSHIQTLQVFSWNGTQKGCREEVHWCSHGEEEKNVGDIPTTQKHNGNGHYQTGDQRFCSYAQATEWDKTLGENENRDASK